MACGVNFCIHDVKSGATEKTNDTGKKIDLVEGVGHDFDASAMLIHACFDDGFFAISAVVQGTGMPGNLFGCMAQKINAVELIPQAFMSIFGECEIA